MRLTVLEPRLSPTLVLPDAYRLTQLVPFIASKDSSTFSFPGDHATVMGMTACFIWYFCGRKYGIPAAIIAAICSIPRTVGGAHWLSDVLVSAPAIMLVAVALALATPFADWMIARIQTITTPLFNRFLPNL